MSVNPPPIRRRPHDERYTPVYEPGLIRRFVGRVWDVLGNVLWFLPW